MSIKEHPGYIGLFSKEQAEGAIPNGTPIVKSWCEVGDSHDIGQTGTVLGSILVPEDLVPKKLSLDSKYFYWVEWDDIPRRAVGILGKKIGRKNETGTNEKWL